MAAAERGLRSSADRAPSRSPPWCYPSGVQRVANDLVVCGLAELRHNPDHRTSPLLVLTENGRRVLQAITERAIVVNNRLADAVDPAALQATRDSLRRMIVALKAERP